MFDSPVRYNGFNLNTTELAGTNGKRRGALLEVFDYGTSRGIGYTEKRSQDDGLDASDVYMGGRLITLAGTVYGEDEADLNDLLQGVRTALTPTSAYAFDRDDYGYIPLEFELKTKDPRFGEGKRLVEYRARPLMQPQFTLRRDGGSAPGAGDEFGMAVSYQSQLECKDPRLYVRPDTWMYWNTAQTAVPILNRGDYPAPLDILLHINASTATSRVEIDIGGSNLSIACPSLATNAIVRYSGELKVLTLDNASGGAADVLRMDLLTFRNNTTHPKVMPSGDPKYAGDGVFNIRLYNGLTLKTSTRFMYSESFA